MVLGSPSTSIAANLVYGLGVDSIPSAKHIEHDGDVPESQERGPNGRSMYVELFEEMLKVVLAEEGRLFLKEELDCFLAWHRLPYNAKYLFCRLCLRKTDKWHRLDSLKYEAELGVDGILDAVQRLSGYFQDQYPDIKPKLEDLDHTIVVPDLLPNLFIEDVKPKIEHNDVTIPPPPETAGPEIIDLTMDEDEDAPKANPSSSPVEESPTSVPTSSPETRILDYSVFAHDEEKASNWELLECLSGPELEDLAKQLRLKPRGNTKKRDVLIQAIMNGSASQTTLSFLSTSKKGKEPMIQTKLPFDIKKSQKSLTQSKLPFKPTPECQKTQQYRLRVLVTEKLKKCVRLNADVIALFHRANLVYFRSTQYTPELLTPALLVRAKKRVYANYLYARTPDIWPTRQDLLTYEEALGIEAEVDALLEFSGGSSGVREQSAVSRTPAPSGTRLGTPYTPVKKEKGVANGEEQESDRVRNARQVKGIVTEVYPKWRDLVAAKGEDDPRRKGLERFDCGHILTRVVCKGAYALGILKEYYAELEMLEALLQQRRWRRGRRGRWYERRALVLMTHLKSEEGRSEAAMQVVVNALKDPDTHIVFRPMLERRLTKLERRLKVPPEEQHVCAGGLKVATEVYLEGLRIRHRASSLLLDQTGRVVTKSPGKTQGLSWSNRRVPTPKKPKESKPEKGGKSIWKGRDDEEVNVETFALQYYEDQHGCKGFHSEGRIVTTLFGLLFWDVIFASIPGAFETRFQSAPLDLVEDTFYYSRQDLADARLGDIEAGRAADILERAYDEHKDVMCVGVRWDLYDKADLLGIVRCLDKNALVAICRLMCEDYAGRTAGVPDLIVWNEQEGWAKFVEVKGPGDTLQENQKVWIDVMLQAGMPVEVCHVYERGGDKPKSKGARGSANTPKKRKPAAGQKRKREEDDDTQWLVESEDQDQEVDYSQLDKHSEEEVEAQVSPERKRRKTRIQTKMEMCELPVLGAVPESPLVRKVAGVSSQPEEISLGRPPSSPEIASASPPRRRRD